MDRDYFSYKQLFSDYKILQGDQCGKGGFMYILYLNKYFIQDDV